MNERTHHVTFFTTTGRKYLLTWCVFSVGECATKTLPVALIEKGHGEFIHAKYMDRIDEVYGSLDECAKDHNAIIVDHVTAADN